MTIIIYYNITFCFAHVWIFVWIFLTHLLFRLVEFQEICNTVTETRLCEAFTKTNLSYELFLLKLTFLFNITLLGRIGQALNMACCAVIVVSFTASAGISIPRRKVGGWSGHHNAWLCLEIVFVVDYIKMS